MVSSGRFVIRWSHALWLLLGIVGCGQSASHVPVTGTVKFSDGSVPKGDIATITFQPAGGGGGRGTKGADGTIGEDGSFSLSTLRPGDGALPGDYQVTVRVMEGYPNGKLVVDKKYTDPASTPFSAKVEADGKNHFDFIIEGP
jgi:hypothetical protein